MAATAYETAREIFHWAKDDAARTADVEEAYAAAGANPLRAGGLDSVIQATKNNVTMQKIIGLREIDRQKALRLAIAWLGQGNTPSRRTVGSFYGI